MVSVIYFGPLKNITNCSSESFEQTSFMQLKQNIIQKYGSDIEELMRYCAFWKNGEEFDEDIIGEGDEIEILPPVSGG